MPPMKIMLRFTATSSWCFALDPSTLMQVITLWQVVVIQLNSCMVIFLRACAWYPIQVVDVLM